MKKIKEKLLFIDTETGGIIPSVHSLLSVACVVWDNSKIVDTYNTFISIDNYVCTKEALEINKIDLNEAKKNGLKEKDVINNILRFISKNFSEGQRVNLAGHNVNFDINFLKQLFERNEFNFGDYFSYRVLDTASILKYLFYKGVVNEEISSLDKAIGYFDITIDNRHSALSDATVTAKLFSKLLEL